MQKYQHLFRNNILHMAKEIQWLNVTDYQKKRHTDQVKIIMDILLSGTALIVLLPFFCLLGLIIKLDSPGPVIFSQQRVGKNGQLFRMHKFRSMVVTAEKLLPNLANQNKASGPMFKIKKDPRITRIGRILRKTSLDKFPQLWNVLNGDMSLVGPRPELPSEVAQYTEVQRQRLLIKPGCSGLWQVCDRSNVDFETMIALDLLYLKERCLVFDLLIIFKTIGQLIYSKTAY